MSPEEEENAKASRNIDKGNAEDALKAEAVIKLLLLGAGESGKSTIFKQMKLLHGAGYSQDERIRFKWHIWSNIVETLKNVCEAADTFEYADDIAPGVPKDTYTTIKGMSSETIELNVELGSQFKALWQDPAIQKTLTRRNEFQFINSVGVFMERIEEVSNVNFVPSVDDVLLTRVRTTGIIEDHFIIEGKQIDVIDVGGQRNERRKWIHCFAGVSAVIFVAALSDIDEFLFEDSSVNRMVDALKLFESICNNSHMKGTSMILFLNKSDLFKEKVSRVRIADIPQWADYGGAAHSYEDGLQYFLNKFVSSNRDSTKSIYHHFTCATNRENMQFVLKAVTTIIIQQTLDVMGFSGN